jgi:predicted secreted protein with PEFG-CTERM motif
MKKNEVAILGIFVLATIFIVSQPAFAQYDYNPPPTTPTPKPAVPEFGSMAFLVLAVAILSIVVFADRARLSRL